jgi:hypothetical protein
VLLRGPTPRRSQQAGTEDCSRCASGRETEDASSVKKKKKKKEEKKTKTTKKKKKKERKKKKEKKKKRKKKRSSVLHIATLTLHNPHAHAYAL